MLILLVAPLLQASPGAAGEAATATWPQFRGPNGSGVAPDADPPADVGPDMGVLWKKEVPRSPSSPCVWGERIFLTTFAGGELQTRCYGRDSGDLLWTRGIKPEKLEVFHRSEGSPAASTPATDGTHVVSYFGSVGLICHDFDGKELWRHPMAVTRSAGDFGSGTSPIIAGGMVILNRDQFVDARLLALDVKTGKPVWTTPRPDGYGSFGTPIVWNNAGDDQIVVPGSVRIRGYDLKTGKAHWLVDGLAAFACTTPVASDDHLFFVAWSYGASDSPWPEWEKFRSQHDKDKSGEITMDEFEGQALDYYQGLDLDKDGKVTAADWRKVKARSAEGENMAIAVEPGGEGDITETHVAWSFTKGLPYVASPLLYQDRIYYVRDGGILTCLDAETGDPIYERERIGSGGKYYASPVAAAGRIYLASLEGDLTVIKAGGEKPEVLHRADFEERIAATPAIVGDKLYLRTESKLYAFGPEPGGFVSIFNGKDLDGWEGKPGWWTVEDGAITVESTVKKPCRRHNYLMWRGGKPADFELRLEYRVIGGNSGVQFRSRELPEWDTRGYQADLEAGAQWSGALFEHDRGGIAMRGQKVMIAADGKKQVVQFADPAELQKHIRANDWNSYRIVARGAEIKLFINGKLMSHSIDHQTGKAASKGVLALQMHPGPPMKAQFRRLRIKQFPAAAGEAQPSPRASDPD